MPGLPAGYTTGDGATEGTHACILCFMTDLVHARGQKIPGYVFEGAFLDIFLEHRGRHRVQMKFLLRMTIAATYQIRQHTAITGMRGMLMAAASRMQRNMMLTKMRFETYAKRIETEHHHKTGYQHIPARLWHDTLSYTFLIHTVYSKPRLK